MKYLTKLMMTTLFGIIMLSSAMAQNMNRYVTLTVTDEENIILNFQAASNNVPIKIISGNQEYNLTVDTNWTVGYYATGATTMTIYGDLAKLRCYLNSYEISGLDASHNTALTYLDCSHNKLTSLNISGCTALTYLDCEDNQLTSLDISSCTNLTTFFCNDNKISNLNTSQNTALTNLACENNQLTSLDVSSNTALTTLNCYGNSFNTDDVDALFCSLPERETSDNAKIYILEYSSDPNYNNVIASNKQNALNKNWSVYYREDFNNLDIPETTGSYVCPEFNVGRYITLTVQQGEDIRLNLYANNNNTPVQITSGDNVYNLTVENAWTGYSYYTAGANTMTIYGNISRFKCEDNFEKINGLDASHNNDLTELLCNNNQLSSIDIFDNTILNRLECENNLLTSLNISNSTALKKLLCGSNQLTNLNISNCTALTQLYCNNNQITSLDISQNTVLTEINCYGNSFTTNSLNELFCTLPEKETSDNAKIYILNNVSDANYNNVIASNKQNAIEKNWQVAFYENNNNIPATTGNYDCDNPPINMDRYITLTVTNGENIRLKFQAASNNVPIKIISGNQEYSLTIDTSGTVGYYATGATTMTIYGNITKFVCRNNESKINGLDVSFNRTLTYLNCIRNQITSLDVSESPFLKNLRCGKNQLSSLDATNCTALNWLSCGRNQLTNLDISNCTNLTTLDCYDNQITSLDISSCTNLTMLDCSDNNFTTETLDQLYCSLPYKSEQNTGVIFPFFDFNSDNYDIVMATNIQNAIEKNWKIRCYNGSISESMGDYDCSTDIADIDTANIEVYPNPVKEQLNIQSNTELSKVELYNTQGILVQQSANTQTIDVSNLPSGIYILKLFTEKGVYSTKVVKH